MKRALVAIAIIATTFALTGCGEVEERPDSIERGKRCFDAGGVWNWSEMSGYHCEFGVDE